MSVIRLRFTKNNNLTSPVIRFLTWSKYSHVEFLLDTGYLGALVDGVKLRPFDYNPTCKYQMAEVTIPEEQGLGVSEAIKQSILKFAMDQIGKPYDWTALVGLEIHRDWHSPDSWFCSELIAAAFDKGGFPLIRNIDDRVTPGMIYESELVKLL